MKSLVGKRILFFAPAFFGYENQIANKMVQLGAYVDFYNERSIKSSYAKAMLKISPKIFTLQTKKYYKSIMEENKNKKYDYIFIIKCEMISVSILRSLKKLYPDATLCLYLYDSIKNVKGIQNKMKEFDRVFSFDSEDVKKYSNINLRPLFYLDCYRKDVNNDNNYMYDISFIGTIHSDRYRIIRDIKGIADNSNYRSYFYCYLQNKLTYYIYRFSKREYRNTTSSDFDFQKKSSIEISEIINGSRIVLDIQHPKQSGLTMRTIEMIGMNKKLITTNKNIINYDFYNPKNILIIDRTDIKIPVSFIAVPYESISKDIYEKYSIENWLYDILN